MDNMDTEANFRRGGGGLMGGENIMVLDGG